MSESHPPHRQSFFRVQTPGDGRVIRNAILVTLVGGLGIGSLAYQRQWFVPRPKAAAPSASASAAPPPAARVPRREPLELTEVERAKGFWECILPDPGAGMYAPLRQITMGSISIPATGGHTDDFGYDVIMHFHGYPSAKKVLATTARGVVLAGFDLGNGSGPYADQLGPPQVFARLKDAIASALRAHSGDPRAHIRHLAISAWSAGYGAINSILKSADDGIDAVILLDGLHTGFVNGKKHDDDPASVEPAPIFPVVRYAERALRGEKIFYFSHSHVETDNYVSTTRVAGMLVARLGVTPIAAAPTDDPLGLVSYVDDKGFHLRDARGANEKAHCDQLRNLTEVVRDILEPAWDTPKGFAAERAR